MNTRSLLLFFLFSCLGCAGTMQTARTNGEGNFQFGIESGSAIFPSSGASLITPAFNLAGRYGISETIDLGARIGTSTYELQSKFMLTSPFPSHPNSSSVILSLAPSLTVIGTGNDQGGSFYLGSKIPLLIGIPIGDSELTITPRLSPAFITTGDGSADFAGFILAGGGSLGFAARLADRFWILPEISVDFPFIGGATTQSPGDSEPSARFGGAMIHIGLGLLFGGKSPLIFTID